MTKVFSVYDNKAEAFMQPFFADTVGLALRAFQQNTENKDSVLNKYPNDFVLYEIGQFNDITGELENYETNKNLGIAIEYHPNQELRGVNNG